MCALKQVLAALQGLETNCVNSRPRFGVLNLYQAVAKGTKELVLRNAVPFGV